MITRSANKKDSFPQSEIVVPEQSGIRNESSTSENSNEKKNSDDSIIPDFPSPTFNIHIHVPHQDPKNANIFLPKIQPIIHLHFDEIVKTLRGNMKVQHDKSLSKTLENWLTKASPKFGNVQFHFKRSSEEKNIANSGICNDIPCSSHTCSNDAVSNEGSSLNSAQNQNVVSEVHDSLNVESSNNSSGKFSNKNDCNYQDVSNYKLDQKVKLKKAVVLLTDICKTKNYKKILAGNESAKNQNNENDSLCKLGDKIENTCNEIGECDTGFIKAEKDSCIIESCTPDLYKNNLNIIESCTVDNHAILPTGSVLNKSHFEKISTKDQNLTSLVEGWNFSDILNRFQMKHSEDLVNCVKYFKDSTQDVICSELNSDKKKKGKKSLEGVEEHSCSDSAKSNENIKSFTEDAALSENKSDRAESPSVICVKSEIENNVFSSHVDLDESRECDFKNASEVKTEYSENQYYDSNLSSDECENTSGKKVESKAFLDLELVERDLSSFKSNFVHENLFEEGAVKNSFLSDPNFHLLLIQKEMQQRNIKTPAKKGKSKNTMSKTPKNLKPNQEAEEWAKADSAPSPKKMRQSDKESKKSEQKSTAAENYIVLNSFGPTQFAVASIDKVKPFKEHEAHNFKRNMLFSNRVNRFSSPNELRVHQLKRDAARRILNK